MYINDFNQKSKSWDNSEKSLRAQEIAKQIHAEILPNNHDLALEYGCGTGLLSIFLQPHLTNIIAADSSSGMLEVLNAKLIQHNIANITTQYLDLTVTTAPKEKFNLIYSLLTLHHIPDISHILATFAQMTQVNGQLFIADLDSEDGSFHGEGFTGHNGFNRERLAKLAIDAGYTQITFTDLAPIIKPDTNNITKSYSMFLMQAIKK